MAANSSTPIDFKRADSQVCPLCLYNGQAIDLPTDGPGYTHCGNCGLVWMEPHSRLSAEAERAHYDTHENDPADLRYRKFLAQLWNPLKARLPGKAKGLDFGSGPGPTFHLLAQEDGFDCTFYDPFYAPVEARLERSYDFIACSETAEHFHDPRKEFLRLCGMLLPGGWLGVMTLRLQNVKELPGWFYRRDPTHVCFYQDQTFSWIAREFGFAEPVFVNPRVVLLQRN